MKKILFLFYLSFSFLYANEAMSIQLIEDKQKIGQGVIQVTVKNISNTDIKILTWNTIFENSIRSDLFLIESDNEILPYYGPIIKRGRVGKSNYIHLKSGEKYVKDVNLSLYYNMKKNYNYKVKYKGNFQTLPQNIDIDISPPISLKYTSSNENYKHLIEIEKNRCSQSEMKILRKAHKKSITLSNNAYKSVGDSLQKERFERWFGENGNKQKIKTSFSKISTALNGQNIPFSCGGSHCEPGDYAYVYSSRPYKMYLCNEFWASSLIGMDSQAGTLIHEMSHFSNISSTHDHVYGIDDAEGLAKSNYERAATNADNYEYFAEDFDFYFTIRTTTEYHHTSKKHRPKGASISGPMTLTSSYISSNESRQVMYIDPKVGVITLVGLEDKAKNKYESEGYKFDKKNCAFVHKRGQTKIDDNPESSLARIVKHNLFSTDENNAFIELKVSNNNFTKKFKIPWSSLKEGGSWSGSGSKSKYDDPSAEDKAMENKIKNSEAYKMIVGTGKAMENSDILAKNNENARKGAAILGMSKEQVCTVYSAEFLFAQFESVDLSFNAKIDVDISPSSKSDREEFTLYSGRGKVNSIKGRDIVLSKYEKDSKGLFGSLLNSMYDKMSQEDKDAWDNAEKEFEEEAQNKKDLEEFENLSIDDLEMFSK